jgi:hypothetical protein
MKSGVASALACAQLKLRRQTTKNDPASHGQVGLPHGRLCEKASAQAKACATKSVRQLHEQAKACVTRPVAEARIQAKACVTRKQARTPIPQI